MKIDVKIETVDSLDSYDANGYTVWQRVEKLKTAIEGYKGSELCRTLGNTYIRPPVMRTNAIMKNVDLKACLTLWQYIESYDKVGYEINVQNTAMQPQAEYVDDFYKLVVLNLLLFRTYNNNDSTDKMKELKTSTSKPLAPKFIKKFDKELAADYSVSSETTAGYIAAEGTFRFEKRLPVDLNVMFEQLSEVIKIETAYLAELEQTRQEEEKRRQEEEARLAEQKRIEEARLAELERIRIEKEEEERRVQEMLEKKRAEQEAEERERQRLEEERLARLEEMRLREEEKRLKREEEERIAAERERIRQNKEMARNELGEAEGLDEEALQTKEPDESELEKQAYSEVTEEEIAEVKAEMDENGDEEAFEDPRAVAARKKLEQQRLEKERAEAERAQRLKAERKRLESKPFKEIYREYSWNPIYVLIRLIKHLLAVVFGIVPEDTDNPRYRQILADRKKKQELKEQEKQQRQDVEVYYKKYARSPKYDIMRFISDMKFKRKKRKADKNKPRPAYTPPKRTPEEQKAIDLEMKRLYREYRVSVIRKISRAVQERKNDKLEIEKSIRESEASISNEDIKDTEKEDNSNRISNIIVIVITAIALAFVIYVMACSAQGKAVKVFGKSVLKVVTGSMEPSIHVGDYIVVEKTDTDALSEGDIISFYSEQSDIRGLLVTHRIVGKNDDGSYITKGDANPVSDTVSVPQDKIVGKYTGKARFFIWVNSFMDVKKLLLLLVVIPMLFISMYEAKTVVKIGREAAEKEKLTPEEKRNAAMREAIEKEKKRLEEIGYDPENEVKTIESRETDEKEND